MAADEILRGMEEQANDSRVTAHHHITELAQGENSHCHQY